MCRCGSFSIEIQWVGGSGEEAMNRQCAQDEPRPSTTTPNAISGPISSFRSWLSIRFHFSPHFLIGFDQRSAVVMQLRWVFSLPPPPPVDVVDVVDVVAGGGGDDGVGKLGRLGVVIGLYLGGRWPEMDGWMDEWMDGWMDGWMSYLTKVRRANPGLGFD